jgi:hypothetical protein
VGEATIGAGPGERSEVILTIISMIPLYRKNTNFYFTSFTSVVRPCYRNGKGEVSRLTTKQKYLISQYQDD